MRLIGLAVFVSAVSGATTLLVPSAERSVDRSQLTASIDDRAGDVTLAQVALPAERPRARYRYSVIPRGVFSARELNAAMTADPVVAAHYQTFDASRATLVPLEQARLAYVSYRLGDRVFWTSRPVRLPAGELVLTDGREIVRARCGNRISAVPGEIATEAPDPIALDTVESDPSVVDPFAVPVATPTAFAGDAVLLLTPPAVVESGNVEPVAPSQPPGPAEPGPLVGAPVIVNTPGPRVRSVPEPGSALLLTAGLVGIGWRLRRRS